MMGVILLNLPEVIARDILVGWLKLKEVVRLESAFCNRKSRKCFIGIAYDGWLPYTANGADEQSPEVIRWCLSRRVKLNGVWLRDCFLDGGAWWSRILQSQGSLLNWINISDDVGMDCRHVLIDIAEHCPHVTSVDITIYRYLHRESWEHLLWDDQLLRLTIACPLRSLTLSDLRYTSDGLCEALRRCTQLENLTITDGAVPLPIEVAIPSLTFLDIRNHNATDDVLIAIGQRCPSLQSLYVFESSAGVSNTGLAAVIEGCPLLRDTDVILAEGFSHDLRVALMKRSDPTELLLDTWADMDADLVVQLLSACPRLTALDCKFLNCVTDTSLEVCGRHCLLLERIHLTAYDTITVEGFMHLLRPGNQLRAINISTCDHLRDDFVVAIAQHCPLLEKLECSSVGVSDASIALLAQGCPRLRHLDVRHNDVGDAGLTALACHCPGLEWVACGKLCTLQGVLALVEHCTHLVTLFVPENLHEQVAALPEVTVRGIAANKVEPDWSEEPWDTGNWEEL